MTIQTAKEQTKRARNAALRILKLKKNKLLRAAKKVVNLKFPKMALKEEKAIPQQHHPEKREESEPLTDSFKRKDICFKRLC